MVYVLLFLVSSFCFYLKLNSKPNQRRGGIAHEKKSSNSYDSYYDFRYLCTLS
jgi:hypothetical protein